MKIQMKKLVLTLMIGILTIGSLGAITSFSKISDAQARNYEASSPNVALAMAYYDAYRSVDRIDDTDGGKSRATFQENIKNILGKNSEYSNQKFSNIGLLIGPRTEGASGAFDQFLNPNTLSEAEILAGYPFPKDDALAYQAFGLAIHDTIREAGKLTSKDKDIEVAMDGIANTARGMSTIGVKLLGDYNPGPIVEAFYDSSALTQYPDNKLVAAVNRSTDLREIILLFGSPIGDFNVAGRAPSLTLVLLTLIVMGLLIASVLMTLANGRAAGESIRKIMVRVAVSAVAVPLVVSLLNSGVTWVTEVTTSTEENSSVTVIQNHLNFADWYSLGFPIPPGQELRINSNGKFVFTPDIIKSINDYTYKEITGTAGSSAQVKARMDSAGSDNNNRSVAVFHKPAVKGDDGKWITTHVYDAAEALGENDPDKKVQINNYATAGYEYFRGGTTAVTADGTGYKVSHESGINKTTYGLSPITAYNLMNSTFTKTGITALPKGGNTYPSVAYYLGTGMPSESGMKTLHPIVNVMATFTMVMAALQGLFSILTNGFGGIVAGGAKSTLGSSSGFGQALGGVIAVVAGVFGIGLIMSISFGLLGELQAIIFELFWYGGGDTSVIDAALEPIRSALKDIWLIGGFLSGLLSAVVPFIITVIAMIAIPKFGAIPIRIFSEKMAELPNVMADRAQQLENRFTGDYRAGGGYGGGGGGSGSVGSQLGSAVTSSMDGAKHVGLGGAAMAGAAASLTGGLMMKLGDESNSHSEGDNSDEKTLNDTESESTNENSESSESDTLTGPVTNDSTTESQSDHDSEVQQSDSFVADGTGSTESSTLTQQDSEATNQSQDSVQNTHNSDGTQSSQEKSLSENNATSDSVTDEGRQEAIMQSEQSAVSNTSMSSEASTTSDTLNDSKQVNVPSDNASSMTNVEGDRVAVSGGDGPVPPKDGSISSSQNGSTPSKTAGKKPSKVKAGLRVAGKGLSVMGGNKSTGQAVKQMVVGAAHMTTSSVGLQNLTTKQLDKAVRKNDTDGSNSGQQQAQQKPTVTKQQTKQARRNFENQMQYEEDRRNK